MKLLLTAALLIGVASSASAQSNTIRHALQVGVGITQALDVHSTLLAVGNGTGREGNTIMVALVDRPAWLCVTKGAFAVSAVLATEMLAKRGHKTAAVVLLAALTSSSAIIAAHNYRIATGRH